MRYGEKHLTLLFLHHKIRSRSVDFSISRSEIVGRAYRNARLTYARATLPRTRNHQSRRGLRDGYS